ncbi:MAG: 16S rRNA (uracil(1498)-N(3))-methyltransferase [Burkholderiales bacterium]|nr:16S rRNA (uracil(1498)-N(3))-methyltransferase [Burkholderiales bacterium]
MPRFYVPETLEIGLRLALPTALAHHVQVLRLQVGDVISLFHGDGGEYGASIIAIEKKQVSVEIKTFAPTEIELPYALTLAQALPESSKMDWIIEKAVELGVAGIQPLAAQRSVQKLSAERAEKRFTHWQGIIIAASEQCGRNRLARLAPLASVEQWLSQQDLHKRVLLSPRAETTLADWARHHPPQALTLMIGPEGGFSSQEEDLALAHGALAFGLGPRVLRTETAGLAALASLQAVWGG